MTKRTSMLAVVQEALRLAILEQALEPGAKLPEDAVGEQFGVSRTIARRALERLAAEELVEIQPNRSASVIRPTLAEAHDLFGVRIDLEDVVVRRLCGRLSAASKKRLKAAVAAEDAAYRARSPEYIRLSAQFHILLAEMTGSPLLSRTLRQIIWRSAVVLRLYGRPNWDDRGHEHHDLIALIADGPLANAQVAMREHLQSVLTRALDGAKLPSDPTLKDVLSHYVAAAKGAATTRGRAKGRSHPTDALHDLAD
jgi:DNA-binding GntR family transcriptional regulator